MLQRAAQEVGTRSDEHGIDEWTVLDEGVWADEVRTRLDGMTRLT